MINNYVNYEEVRHENILRHFLFGEKFGKYNFSVIKIFHPLACSFEPPLFSIILGVIMINIFLYLHLMLSSPPFFWNEKLLK